MTKPIPKWVMLSYSKLLSAFGEKPFTSEQAKKILDNKTAPILHKLNKSEWIEFVGFDKDDTRKRFYKLKNPQEALSNLQEDEKNGKPKKHSNKKQKRKRS